MSDTMSEAVRLINLTDTAVVTEEELLERAREGDKSAFGALYLRHREAARKVASMCATSPADAEDAVAEGFARVFAALPRMAGRAIAFRPYLLTCVRNAATDRLRRERRVDLRESLPETPAGLQADDVALLGLERNLVGEALQALPARWRTVLWLTEVEGLSPAEVSRQIGIKPNAVAALAYRARKGLREAYLQAHLRAEASQECRATVSRLGNYVRGELPEKDRLAVHAHLDECAKCRCRRDELTDVNATLRHALLPVPLLLAGTQHRWFGLGQLGGSQFWARAPELTQVAQAADSPLVHKAVAGITMVVLAISGAAVPHVADSQKAQGDDPEVALARPVNVLANVVREVAVIPVPGALGRGPADEAASAPAAPAAPAPADAAVAPEEGGPLGGGRSRLFPYLGDRPDEGRGRPGGTRQRLLRPPGDGSAPDDGLLAGTPVDGLITEVLGTVDQVVSPVLDEVVSPVLDAGVSSPAPQSTTLVPAPAEAVAAVVDEPPAPVGEVLAALE